MSKLVSRSRGYWKTGGAGWVSAAALALGWSTGCWLDRIPIEDLGSTGGGEGGSPPSNPEPEPEPDPVKDYLEQIDPGLVGRWEGYVEDPFRPDEDGRPTPAVFPSGSTRVTLEYRFGLDEFGEREVPTAMLIFGATPAPTPERGVAYPPGAHHYFGYLSGTPFDSPVVEGFEYYLQEFEQRFAGYDPGHGSLLAFRRFVPFIEWCQVQEGLDQGDGDYDCLGASGWSGGDPILGEPCTVHRSDGSMEQVDCDFVAMCSTDLCVCAQYGCDLNLERYLDVMGQIFLERQGDQLVGTISGATLDTGRPGWYSPMGTLRLSRVE